MSIVKIANGIEIKVDPSDLEYVRSHNWCLTASYPSHRVGNKISYRHRELMVNELSDGQSVDHISGDKLDARRSNLRVCSHQQNHFNEKLSKNSTSGFKGVAKSGNKWRAYIKHFGKQIHLGLFDTPEEASTAYIEKAHQLVGEFARVA